MNAGSFVFTHHVRNLHLCIITYQWRTPNPTKPYKSFFLETWVSPPHANPHTQPPWHTQPHNTVQRDYCFWRKSTASPSFTQGKCSGLAWRPAWQWGVCWGRKAASWGRRLGWMGAAVWHREPGTEAITDGRWAARLQGDAFGKAVTQRAAREWWNAQEGEDIQILTVYCQIKHMVTNYSCYTAFL